MKGITMKKKVVSLLLAVACAFSLVALSACSQSNDTGNDEAEIKDAVTSTLETLVDKDTISTLFHSIDGVEDLESYGLDVDALSEAIASSFSYEVENVTIDGDSATATAKMSYPDYESDELTDLLQEKIDAANIAEMTDMEEIMSAYQEAMIAALTDENLPQASQEFEVPCVKENGAWTIEDKDALMEEAEALLSSVSSTNSSSSSAESSSAE